VVPCVKTSCYSNGGNRPHRRRAMIVPSCLPRALVTLIIFMSMTYVLTEGCKLNVSQFFFHEHTSIYYVYRRNLPTFFRFCVLCIVLMILRFIVYVSVSSMISY